MQNYIIQKAQKIVSALYIITDLIKDNDAMKWELREEGLEYIANAIPFNETDISLSPIERENFVDLFFSTHHKLLSFLKVARDSALISPMNAKIVIHEMESLGEFLGKENMKQERLPGYILSDSFFATDTPAISNKGQDNVLRTINTPKNKDNYGTLAVKDKKNNRQETILSLLKKDSNLTIKDFAKVVTGCSEKTIQRELTLLVEKGVVKKVGERRWSSYSLNL